MLRLKDIAAAMDVHPRTAKRWWKKIDAECRRLRLPRVKPDVMGHGAHRWKPATAQRLLKLWSAYYQTHGTSPVILRAKYAGDLNDARQLILFSTNENHPRQRLHGSGAGTARSGIGSAVPGVPARKTSQRR